MSGRAKQCHGCHGPCDASHKGYPTGADRCPLEHDVRCEGGIRAGLDRSERKWRACPRGYVFVEDDYEDEDEDYLTDGGSFSERTDVVIEGNGIAGSLAGMSLMSSTSCSKNVPSLLSAKPVSTSLGNLSEAVTTTAASTSVVTAITKSAAHTVLSSSGIGLTSSVQEGDSVSQQVLAAKSRLLAMQKKRKDLEVLAELQKQEELEAAQTEQLQEQIRTGVRPKVKDGAARLRARNQIDKQADDQGFYGGPTISQIRKASGLASVVENDVDRVRSDVPSLSRRPSVCLGGPGGGFQPGLSGRARSAGQRSNKVVFDPLERSRPKVIPKQSYVSDLVVIDDSAQHSYPGANKQPVGVSRRKQVDFLTGDPETDPSDSEPEEQQMRLVYRRDRAGNKYREWEPVPAEQSPECEPEPVFEWVTDQRTGRQYKQQVHIGNTSGKGLRDHRSSSFTSGVRPSQQASSYERAPTFVPLPISEREGVI